MAKEYSYLTIEDVSEMLKVARSTVYKFKDMGMPFIKIGKTIRFKDNEVMQWVESHSTSTNNDK
ncbi:MAG TPA: helix-turn-helix domain-containing protein [Bacillota bacterium]|nr:helix-turn-helix domain-containing protein [Bacillota bacterium]